MSNENFFKHDDKAYTENLNDAILIANAFDYQVPVNIPGMYNNNHYPNDNNIHKVGVADVTIVSSGSLSIGDTAITNNSNTSQVLRLRVYPNFNSFYSWKDISWTATGEISIDICNAGTTTSLLPAGELTNPDGNRLSGIASLQGLKEYDLLITIPVNGILNTLSIVFVNNWNSQNRVSASISQANVSGLVDDLSRLDDVPQEISNLNTEVWGSDTQTGDSRIYELEHRADGLGARITSLDTSIANLVQVQEVSVNMGTISSGGNVTKTATVTACPTGYSSMILVKTTSWCVCSASSLTGTTLSVTGMNLHSGSHTCWISVYVVYYPSAWSI